jgi:S-adenosylmethionine:tRNA ribosyltransferase-isomerase
MNKASDYDYHLPEELIAQTPADPRDSARLLHLNKLTGAIEHHHIPDLVSILNEGDVLVMNQTKVFKARLFAEVEERNFKEKREVVLIRPIMETLENSVWEVLLNRMRKVHIGDILHFGSAFTAKLIKKNPEAGIAVLEFQMPKHAVIAKANDLGEVPLPPYIENDLESLDTYQTVYAKQIGSVAAPTAGLHFTDQVLSALKEKGVQIEFVTLHVGIGTFQPLWFDELDDHTMHSEWVQITPETSSRINAAKADGRRVIAVGTTTTRALEGAASEGILPADGFIGDVDLFIRPGFDFQIINGLMTNFHLPKTTLLVLVSALAGREHILRAYHEAIEEKYRFYSFGDAMLIL